MDNWLTLSQSCHSWSPNGLTVSSSVQNVHNNLVQKCSLIFDVVLSVLTFINESRSSRLVY